MKINELKYTKRFNVGNYEHEEISVGVAVEAGESASEVLQQMKEFVATRGIAPITSINGPVVEGNTGAMEMAAATSISAAPSEPAAQAPKRGRKPKEPAAQAEQSAVVQLPETVKIDPKLASPTPETKPSLSVVKEEPKQDPAPESKPKFRERKLTKYSRGNELHKKMVVDYLDSKYPDWKKSMAVKAKDVSAKLENTDFLDAEGMMLPTFKEAFDSALRNQ